MTTGVLFWPDPLAHLGRMVEERQGATKPWYVLITLAAEALCVSEKGNHPTGASAEIVSQAASRSDPELSERSGSER